MYPLVHLARPEPLEILREAHAAQHDEERRGAVEPVLGQPALGQLRGQTRYAVAPWERRAR